jgi:acylphosphatase
MKFPVFTESKFVTKEYTFIGKVQRVGFRAEMKYIADQLNVKGYVRNSKKNEVYALLQGPMDKVNHIVKRMNDEKRITINKMTSQIIKSAKSYKKFEIK